MANPTRTATALRRASEALLYAAGARSVKLRVPAPAVPTDNSEQLGLATPEFQDIELGRVAFRTAVAKTAEGKANRRSLIVSASAVETLTGQHGYASSRALFASAFGVLVDQVMLTITSASEIEAAGLIYAYRLELREPLAEIV